GGKPDASVKLFKAAAAANAAPPALAEAVASLWPRKDVQLAVTAAPFASPDGGATVAVVLHARQDEAGAVGKVNVLAGAFDQFGASSAIQRQIVSLSPRPNARGEFEYDVVPWYGLTPARS